MTSKYDIPFNTQLSDKLKGVLGKIHFKSFKKGNKRELQHIKDQHFILPPLDKYKEEGVDHINILTDKTRLGSLLSIESVLEFDHDVYGTFRTIRGFLSYISSVEKDDRLRRLQGRQLRELSSLMTKNKEKNVRVEVMKAVYQRILQYKDAVDTIKACSLPIDCYYVNSSNIKIRPTYSSWYIKGLQIIIEAIKADKEPDLSILSSSGKNKANKRKGITRLTKASVVKYYYTNFLSKLKNLFRSPEYRLKMAFNLDVDEHLNDLESLIPELTTLAESHEEVNELIDLVNEILDSNNRFKLKFTSYVEDVEDEESVHLKHIHALFVLKSTFEKSTNELDELFNRICSDVTGLSYIEDIYKVIEEKLANTLHTNFSVENYYQEIINDIRDNKYKDIPSNVADAFTPTYNISNTLLANVAFSLDDSVVKTIKSRFDEIEKLVGKERFNSIAWVYEYLDYFITNRSAKYPINDSVEKLVEEVTSIITNDDAIKADKNYDTLISRYTETCLALVLFSRIANNDFEWFDEEYGNKVLVSMTGENNDVDEFLDKLRARLNNMLRTF